MQQANMNISNENVSNISNISNTSEKPFEENLISSMNPAAPMPEMVPSCRCPMQSIPFMSRKVQMAYPEVYYKLQPYILIACDQMDSFGPMMPSQEMIEQMGDGIYEDVCRMHPDLAEYARESEQKMKDNDPSDPPFGIGLGMLGFGPGFSHPGFFDRRFRRRGLFRDMIDILLLSELSLRRRFF